MHTETILQGLIRTGEALMLLNLVALLAGTVEARVRPSSVSLLFASVQFWALILIIWCAFTVHAVSGWLLTILGLIFSIIGIIPTALVCLIVSRNWTGILDLVFQTVLVGGGYMILKRMRQHDS